jgi:hypothetical protein
MMNTEQILELSKKHQFNTGVELVESNDEFMVFLNNGGHLDTDIFPVATY